MSLPPLPPAFKPLQRFLKAAQQLEKAEPWMSYFCRYYAVQLGIQVHGKGATDEGKKFLLALMDKMEKDKAAIQPPSDAEAKEYVKNFAFKVFKAADDPDRAGNATKTTARDFLHASVFMDCYQQFEPLPKEMAELKKYAKWKALEITQALARGEKPTAGPVGFVADEIPQGDDDEFASLASMSAKPPTQSIAKSQVAPQASSPFPSVPPSGTTLPSAPVTLPSAPVTLPSAPVTLPSAPVTLPSVPKAATPQLPSVPPSMNQSKVNFSDVPEPSFNVTPQPNIQHIQPQKQSQIPTVPNNQGLQPQKPPSMTPPPIDNDFQELDASMKDYFSDIPKPQNSTPTPQAPRQQPSQPPQQFTQQPRSQNPQQQFPQNNQKLPQQQNPPQQQAPQYHQQPPQQFTQSQPPQQPAPQYHQPPQQFTQSQPPPQQQFHQHQQQNAYQAPQNFSQPKPAPQFTQSQPPSQYAQCSEESVLTATTHAKYALSALQFDDVPTAIKNLQKALELLTSPSSYSSM